MTVAIFIPSRLESSRLPKKALQLIGDKPMVAHVVDRAIEANAGQVIVATDSVDIMQAITQDGVQCLMTSKEHQNGSDRIYEALEKLDPKKTIKYVMNLQGDMPFIKSKALHDLIDKIGQSKADVITIATPINQKEIGKVSNDNVTKAVISFYDDSKKFGKALYFSRQPVPYNAPVYYEHMGVYLFKREALEKFVNLSSAGLEKVEKLEQLRLLENNMTIDVLITESPTISVDSQEELDEARAAFEKLQPKVNA